MSQTPESRRNYKDVIRGWARKFAHRFLMASWITADRITVGGPVIALAGCVVWTQQLRWAWFVPVGMVIVVIGCSSDLLDGAVARMKGPTVFGNHLDSITDRAMDMGLMAALTWVLIQQGHKWGALACVVALGGSNGISYVRAKCELLGVKGDVGLADRPFRMGYLALTGIVGYWTGYQWWVYGLAALTWITVLQRTLHMRKELRGKKDE